VTPKFTGRFAVQAWNSNDGYPAATGFFRERLVWARGSQFWLSQPGDFINFAEFDVNGDVTDESAISVTLPSPAAVRWFEETEQGLFVSTDDGEWIISEINPSDPLSATNIRARRQSRYGSSPMAGTQIGEAIVFAQRGGRKLREAVFAFENESFKSRNLTVLSDHVTRGGLKWMAFQQEPHAVMWSGRGDNTLLGFTYDREQEVYGWHPHEMGGVDVVVESGVTIPSPDGSQDDLWLIVQRDPALHGRRGAAVPGRQREGRAHLHRPRPTAAHDRRGVDAAHGQAGLTGGAMWSKSPGLSPSEVSRDSFATSSASPSSATSDRRGNLGVAAICVGTGAFVSLLTLWLIGKSMEGSHVYFAIAVAGYGGPVTLDFFLQLG
jgi:hypothetical protein